ncbi:flagellar basal-body MS-ring/collar protein FliF [Paenibacillus sp. Marseille-Q4541]|uniref:flagellar basal-body MS-ring/collar protein FliF n=1 Tax=Paenibacillus sp. Marseille-Q4541 TaxID=2831522 RepID=UPI001BAD43F5
MNERIAQYREKISQYWNKFTSKQKVLLISTVVFLIIAIVALTIQFSKTEYEVAFTDLGAEDSAGVINYLESGNIPFELSKDGSSISVPSTQAARVKVDVGSQGLIQNGSIGYDIFDQNASTMGMTDKEFQVKYANAFNGEIEQMLQSMEGVSGAKVLVNLPEKSLFAGSEQNFASASAVLTFEPGYQMTQNAVDGYFNLMKTAVPNLPLENITISTNQGEELQPSERGGGSGLGEVQENMALQKKYESDVQKSVKEFLSGIIGTSDVNVLVTSNLNFDKVNTTQNLVTPVDEENMKGIEISVQDIQSSYTGGSTANGGVAGTGESDVVNYPAADTDTSSGEDSSTTINYEVNRIAKEIVQSPYTVKDLTINVAVEPPAGQNVLDTPTQEAIQTVLVNIVRASLANSGSTYIDADLEKKVSVISKPAQAVADSKTGIQLSSGMIWGLAAGAALLLAGGGYLIYRNRRNKEEEYEEDLPLQVPTEFPSISLETVTNESQVRKQLESLAKKKPDEFVNLLRTWLADE